MNDFVCGSDMPLKILAIINYNWRWLVIGWVFANVVLAIVGYINVGSIVNTFFTYTQKKIRSKRSKIKNKRCQKVREPVC